MSSLKSNKATDCDNIPSELLTIGAFVLCEPLRYLVNVSIGTSVFPDSLKTAEVSPVYKNGSILNKKNYRPISVLPSDLKYLKRFIAHQLSSFCDSKFSL